MNASDTRPYGGPLTTSASILTVDALFRRRVRAAPDAPALRAGARTRSYAELDARVRCLHAWLHDAGVRAGDRVAVVSENRAEYVELQLAAARGGFIVACQNWRLAPDELTHCLTLVEPKIAFVSERYAESVRRLDCTFEHVVTFGDDFERRLADAPGEREGDARAEGGLVILYTSGTTGLPKGAVISQRAMVARAQVCLIDGPLVAGTTFIAWAPMFHMISTDNILATLMTGGKVVLLDGFDAPAFVAAMAGEDIGWLQVLPGMIEPMLVELRKATVPPKHVNAVGCMADLVPRRQIAELTRLVDAPYVNSFGSTETGTPPGSANVVAVGAEPDRLPKTLNSFCDIRLVDEDEADVADGDPGELAVRGPTLFSGYWGVPESKDFRDGWFHLGDVFRRNPDGSYDFVDRRKYLIKSGGENIYPAEIERVLLASSRVADAAVVRYPDERWGEVPIAFVVRADERLTPEDVVDLCRNRIASYKIPKGVRFIAEADLPRTSTGKIKRHELETVLARERQANAATR